MFKWLKSLGKKEVEKQKAPLEETVSKVDDKEKTSLSISEPVTSFIKCFNQNPRRFKMVKVKDANTRNSYYSSSRFTFTDTKTAESWNITYRPYYSMPHIENTTWLTNDERELLNEVLMNHYLGRSIKLDKLRKDKAHAKIDKERARLTKIYKENE